MGFLFQVDLSNTGTSYVHMRGGKHCVSFAKEDQYVFRTSSAPYVVCVKALERVATVGAHTAHPTASAPREQNNKYNKLRFCFQVQGLYVTLRMCHREYMSHAHAFADQLQQYMSRRYVETFEQQSVESGYQYECMPIVDGWRNQSHTQSWY